MARTCCSSALVALYGALVLAVPVCLAPMQFDPAPVSVHPDEVRAPTGDPEATRALAGIWWRYEAGVEGDPVRFYYFHGDGKGLYRYGRVGLTNTNSFDYEVQGDTLSLRFRKTGERHSVRFRIEREGGRDWMVLQDDPREPGSTRYFRESDRTVRGPAPQHPEPGLGPAPAGHMWIDQTPYATGGYAFSLYQFRPAGIDGRGTGWHHRGDFDDWSTESLVYRIVGDTIELTFPLREGRHVTRFEIIGEGDDRKMFMASDPRDFWHPHTYRDIGVSFGALGSLPPPADPRSPLHAVVTTPGLGER
jgi:hypothetical protein